MVSDDGLALLKHFEGYEAEPYLCPAGKWTIGYGHVVQEGETMEFLSQSQAEMLLMKDVIYIENQMDKFMPPGLEEHKRTSLVCFAYNVGVEALRRSTLLKKCKIEDFIGASREFDRWIYAAGRILPGLKRRRAAERVMFEGGDWRNALN